jgi:acyl-CoA synthetase (AMP-forming)/AMP-acid ligase II
MGAIGCLHRDRCENRQRIAIHAPSENVSGRSVIWRATSLDFVAAFGQLGLPSRPTVVSNVGNHSGFIALFVATLASDGTFLAIDGDAPATELLALAETCGADLVVARSGHGVLDGLSPVALPCGLLASVRHVDSTPAWRAIPESGALVLRLTSGSTRASKVVVASEQNLFSDGSHIAEAMDIGRRDVNLATIPLAHAYMGSPVLPCCRAGFNGPARSPADAVDRTLPRTA